MRPNAAFRSTILLALLAAALLSPALGGCGRQPEAGRQEAAAGTAADGEAAAGGGTLLGDRAGAGLMSYSGDVVTVALQPARLLARPGEAVALQAQLDIEPPWHLYAHEDTAYLGIELTAEEGLPLAGLQVGYPEGESARFFGEAVLVLAGRQAIRVSGRVPADLAPGTHPLAFRLAVQACDDRRCLAPAFLPLQGELEVPAAP